MAEIVLSDGTFVLVDQEDADRYGSQKWFPSRQPDGRVYAQTHRMVDGRKGKVSLHRLILGEPAGLYVDHVNRNTLDCRRTNLRAVTPSVSNRNVAVRGASVYRGVHADNRPGRKPWRVSFAKKWVGAFHDEEEAARAWDTTARAAGEPEALMNFPKESAT